MGSASVTYTVEELTTPPEGSSALIYALVLPAPKGSYEPRFLTSLPKIKQKYTSRGIFADDTDMAMFALKKFADAGDITALVVRPYRNELIAGATLKAPTSTIKFDTISAEESLALGDTFVITTTCYITTKSVTVPTEVTTSWLSSNTTVLGISTIGVLESTVIASTLSASTVTSSGTTYSVGDYLYYNGIVYTCKKDTKVPNKVSQSWLYNNFNMLETSAKGVEALTIGITKDTMDTISNYNFTDGDIGIFYCSNGDLWGNNCSVSITNYIDDPNTIGIEGAFQVKFYEYDNLVETYLCTRAKDVYDANGMSMYIEDVINNQSIDFRYKDNTDVSSTISPASQTVPVLFGGATAGEDLTDAMLINALELLSNEDKYSYSLIGNGGHASATYIKALANFNSSRDTGHVSIALPLSLSLSSDPLTAYQDFIDELGISDNRVWFNEFWAKEYDADSGKYRFIPPDGHEAYIYAKLNNEGKDYYPPAGWKQAPLTTTVVNEWDKGSRDVMDKIKINFFKKSKKGTCVFSEATSLQRPSYLQQKHISFALYDLIPRVLDGCEPYLYSLGEAGVYNKITEDMQAIMELFESKKGCDASKKYVVTCSDKNNSQADKDSENCNLWIEYTPLNSIKTIKVTFGLTNGSVSLASITEI